MVSLGTPSPLLLRPQGSRAGARVLPSRGPARTLIPSRGPARTLIGAFLVAVLALAPQALPAAGASTTGKHYDAVFKGDATGRSNVTSSLRSFLQSHNGQHVALAKNGVYRVTQLSFTAHDLTVDFRGSRLQGSQVGAHGILLIHSSRRVKLIHPKVYGTGYKWDPAHQNEHGIWVDGGSDITLYRPVTRDTRGDGVYVAYQAGKNSAPVRITIRKPNIKRASRNGIAPVAGQVTIRGGHIAHTGLHGVDFEVNDAASARSIRGIVDGVDIRHHGDLPAARAHCTCYAVAAAGYSTATKPSIVVEDVTGDLLQMTIRDTASVTVRHNVSDTKTSAGFPRSRSVSFGGNVRIAKR